MAALLDFQNSGKKFPQNFRLLRFVIDEILRSGLEDHHFTDFNELIEVASRKGSRTTKSWRNRSAHDHLYYKSILKSVFRTALIAKGCSPVAEELLRFVIDEILRSGLEDHHFTDFNELIEVASRKGSRTTKSWRNRSAHDHLYVSAVRVNGELTDWFKTTVGVRQGCALSPQLFNILLEAVMLYAIHDTKIGVRVQGQLINNLRFADDIVLIADNDRDLQTIVDLVHQSSSNFGLKINITKTEVQAISKQPQLLNINVGGEQLKQVDKFTYLGGTISQTGSCSEEVKHRIGKAIGAFQALKKIWASQDIRCSTKVDLYKVLVLSILLYGAETWTLKKVDENRLHTFEMACLRRIMGVTRFDRLRNTHIRTQLNMEETIIDRVATKRLRYFGQLSTGMNSKRYPHILLKKIIHGKPPRGRASLREGQDCIRCATAPKTDKLTPLTKMLQR
eukprot:XP_011677635.1 PREDICTED: uncharacterized protein LOC105444715 [Strongylocentrotus purpuratus]